MDGGQLPPVSSKCFPAAERWPLSLLSQNINISLDLNLFFPSSKRIIRVFGEGDRTLFTLRQIHSRRRLGSSCRTFAAGRQD